jgi:hypothetical protein
VTYRSVTYSDWIRARGGSDEISGTIIISIEGNWGGGDDLGERAGAVEGGVFQFYPVFAWEWGGYGWNFTTRAAAI